MISIEGLLQGDPTGIFRKCRQMMALAAIRSVCKADAHALMAGYSSQQGDFLLGQRPDLA